MVRHKRSQLEKANTASEKAVVKLHSKHTITDNGIEIGALRNATHSSDRFHNILVQLGALHEIKSADYGLAEDPYQNFRTSKDLGIDPWMGAFIRLNDKVRRISKFAKTGKLKNESVIDSFNDLAVYAIICRILFEEGQK